MLSDPARISVVQQAHVRGACELCATPAAELRALVLVQHAHGGTVRFVACDGCALAMRRVAAAAGGAAQFAAPEPMASPPRQDETVVVSQTTTTETSAELIEQRAERVVDAAGVEYVPQVYGRERADGTWIGWIEFISFGGGLARRTDAETTQSSREQVAYWASGLEPMYFEGAFARARTVAATA